MNNARKEKMSEWSNAKLRSIKYECVRTYEYVVHGVSEIGHRSFGQIKTNFLLECH